MNTKPSDADLIAQIVDRDTPPDTRNEVVDHDIRGKPITRADVEAGSRCMAQINKNKEKK